MTHLRFFSFFPGIWPSIFACHRLIPTNILTTLQFVPSVVTTMCHLEKWPHSIWRKPKEGLQFGEGVDETYHTSWMVFHLSFRFGLEIHEIEDCLEKIGCDIVCSNIPNHSKQEYGLCFPWVLQNVHSDTGNPVETPRLPRIWLKKQMSRWMSLANVISKHSHVPKCFATYNSFFDILWEAFSTLPLDGHVQPWISRQLFCLLGLSYDISQDGTFPYARCGMYDNLCLCIPECFVGSLSTTTTYTSQSETTTDAPVGCISGFRWQWNA